MLNDYLIELGYPEQDRVAYLEVAKSLDYLERPYGFATYKSKGDAFVIIDMYVKPEFRRQNKAWSLFRDLQSKAIAEGKRVMITFSCKKNQKRDLGLSAIKAGGFIPYQELKNSTAFIVGI